MFHGMSTGVQLLVGQTGKIVFQSIPSTRRREIAQYGLRHGIRLGYQNGIKLVLYAKIGFPNLL